MRNLAAIGVMIGVCAASVSAAPPRSRPATRPVEAAASQPGDAVRLAGGVVEFIPPPGWTKTAVSGADEETAVGFVNAQHDGNIVLTVMPADMEVDAAFRRLVLARLQKNNKTAGAAVLVPPAVQPDKRFALKIHERTKPAEKPLDQLFIYCRAGPKVLLVNVGVFADDEETIKSIHQIGEAAASSIKFVRPVPKRK
jgi:hypothetical protein